LLWIDEQSPSLLAAPQNKGNKGDPKKSLKIEKTKQ
jgi:hypothetical protein